MKTKELIVYSLFQADNQSGKGVCVAASSHLLVEIAEQFDEGADNDDDDAPLNN